jgi:hypothetical protein
LGQGKLALATALPSGDLQANPNSTFGGMHGEVCPKIAKWQFATAMP